MEIVFCRTRYHYQSYTDFWRLVGLAGFEVAWLDELEPGRDAFYIVSPKNGELEGVLPRLEGNRRAKLVWWCLERPNAEGRVTALGETAPPAGIDRLWLSDAGYVGRHERATFVPLGSDERLGEVATLQSKDYDWCHMSYVNPRRQAIYDQLPGKMGPNCWDQERHEVLKASRFMVNIHQDEHPMLEPLRFALATAYGLPILSEEIPDPNPYKATMATVFEGIPEYFGGIILNWNYVEWMLAGEAEESWIHNTQLRPFRVCVEEGARATLEG